MTYYTITTHFEDGSHSKMEGLSFDELLVAVTSANTLGFLRITIEAA